MGLLRLLLLTLVVDAVPEGSADSGEDAATVVTGALGGSATFQLETSEPFTSIFWIKREAKGDPDNVAIMNLEKLCKLSVLLPAFEGRLNASGDCRRLQVEDLSRGDSGRYTAQIQLRSGKDPLRKIFELEVYKRLSEADLAIHCHKTGNGSQRLNCSAGEDDATVSWEEASQAEPSGKFALLPLRVDEEDLNVTCWAENPLGNASRRVYTKEICGGVQGVQASSPLLGATVAVLILTKLMVSACVFATWPCCPRRTNGMLGLPAHLRLGKRVAARRRSFPSS